MMQAIALLTAGASIGAGIGLFICCALRGTSDFMSMTDERRRMLIDDEREQAKRMGGL